MYIYMEWNWNFYANESGNPRIHKFNWKIVIFICDWIMIQNRMIEFVFFYLYNENVFRSRYKQNIKV